MNAGFRRGAAVLMLALSVATGAAQANTNSCKEHAPSVAVTSPGDLRVGFSTRWNGKVAGELPADFRGGPAVGRETRLPDSNVYGMYPEIEWLSVRGRIFDVLNSATFDFAVEWAYAEEGVETRLDGKPYFLARKDLQQYPNLLARFRAARIDFDEVRISMIGEWAAPGGHRTWELVSVILPGGHFFIPNDGEEAISGPSSPARWTERLQIGATGRKGYLNDEETRAQWQRILAVRCAEVSFIGLRVPQAQLERIARDLEKAKKDGEKFEKDYAVLKEGLGKTAVPAYNKGDEMGKPFAIPVTTAEGFQTKDGVGLRKDGKTLWTSNEYRSISKVDTEGRYHRAYLKEDGGARRGGFHLVDARGRVQEVGGLRKFARLDELEGGVIRLFALSPTGSSFETKKFYDWPGIIPGSEISAFRARDSDGRCRQSSGRSGEVSIITVNRYRLDEGTLLTTDTRLRGARSQPAYLPDTISGVGHIYCRAP